MKKNSNYLGNPAVIRFPKPQLYKAEYLAENFDGQVIAYSFCRDGVLVHGTASYKGFEDILINLCQPHCDVKLSTLYCEKANNMLFLKSPICVNSMEADLEDSLAFYSDYSVLNTDQADSFKLMYTKEGDSFTFYGYCFGKLTNFIYGKKILTITPADEIAAAFYKAKNLGMDKTARQSTPFSANVESSESESTESKAPFEFTEDHFGLKTFLKNTSFKSFYDQIRTNIIGQDEQLLIACSNVYRYVQALSEGKTIQSNFLITAPSGCGKSQFFREIRKTLEPYIPVLQIDLSSFTSAGFIGREVSDITRELANAGSKNGEGIIFLDEFDKKVMPSFNSAGDNMNLKVQYELLTMVEGATFSRFDGAKKCVVNTDTANTLFVGLGAFEEVRKQKLRKANKSTIGFTSAIAKEASDKPTDIYLDLVYKDLIDIGGCCAQLMGRFSQVINFHRINDEDYLRIVKQYVRDMPSLPDNCSVSITEDGAKDFLQFADSEMGIREVRRALDLTVQKDIIDMLLDGQNEETHIVITGYMKTELKAKALTY